MCTSTGPPSTKPARAEQARSTFGETLLCRGIASKHGRGEHLQASQVSGPREQVSD